MASFGENLRALRKSRGYSQEKFAQVINSNQAKGVVSVMAARVQIPASPLETPGNTTFLGFCYTVVSQLQIVVKSIKLESTVYITAYKHSDSTAYNGETFFLFSHYSPVRGVVFPHTTPRRNLYTIRTILHLSVQRLHGNVFLLTICNRKDPLYEHKIRPHPPDPSRS